MMNKKYESMQILYLLELKILMSDFKIDNLLVAQMATMACADGALLTVPENSSKMDFYLIQAASCLTSYLQKVMVQQVIHNLLNV